MVRLGGLISDSALARVRAGEAALAERLGRVFSDHDVLLTPALARPAEEIGHWEGRSALPTLIGVTGFTPWTPAWNATGQPAASIPAGLSRGGLPLAVQVVGRPNDEATLLSLAAQVEAERPWDQQRPPIS
jgi:amidase